MTLVIVDRDVYNTCPFNPVHNDSSSLSALTEAVPSYIWQNRWNSRKISSTILLQRVVMTPICSNNAA